MKKTLKYLSIALFVCLMPKACQMDFHCNVIDSMPKQIYDQIIRENPSWGVDQIANYYLKNQDALIEDIEAEEKYLAELEEYHKQDQEYEEKD